MRNDPVLAASEMRRLTSGKRNSQDPAWFVFGDVTLDPDDVVLRLAPLLTAERMARIEEVLEARTRSLTVVVEGMVDTGNIAAVLRTAEGFGVQEVHTVDTAASYKHSKRTSRGAEKWLDRWRWRSPAECVAWLRASGFRIVAAHLDAAAVPISEVDFSLPTALVFGNEYGGLSEEMVALADATTMVPIDGFVQSYNISVAAALCLSHARRDRMSRLRSAGDLTDADLKRLRAVWYLKTVPHAAKVIERMLTDEAAAEG